MQHSSQVITKHHRLLTTSGSLPSLREWALESVELALNLTSVTYMLTGQLVREGEGPMEFVCLHLNPRSATFQLCVT